jgi:hypothetical protein
MGVRGYNGDKKVGGVGRLPSVINEDSRQLRRKLIDLKAECAGLTNRINGRSAGVSLSMIVGRKLPVRLEGRRRPDDDRSRRRLNNRSSARSSGCCWGGGHASQSGRPVGMTDPLRRRRWRTKHKKHATARRRSAIRGGRAGRRARPQFSGNNRMIRQQWTVFDRHPVPLRTPI